MNTSSTLDAQNNSQSSQQSASLVLPVVIWSLATLFFGYEFLLKMAPSVMVPELMRDFKVGGIQISFLHDYYMFSYVAMQIPVGVLVDRFGPRRLLTLATFMCAMGSYMFGSTQTFFVAELGRFLIGFGGAFAAVGCMKLTSIWFHPRRFALMAGLMLAAANLSAYFGEQFLAFLVTTLHWRPTMEYSAIFGFVLALLIWLIVRDTNPHATTPIVHEEHKIWQELKGVLKDGQTWLIAAYAGLAYTPTLVFADLWGVPYITQTYHQSKGAAVSMIAMILIGYAAGSPLFGWISDHLGRRKPIMALGSLGGMLSIGAILYMHPLSNIAITAILFSFGFFSSGFFVSFSMIREINNPHSTGTALGFTNMFNMVGGMLVLPIVGWLLDQHWEGVLVDGSRVYSLSNYHHAFLVLPSMFIASMLTLLFIKETYCKQVSR